MGRASHVTSDGRARPTLAAGSLTGNRPHILRTSVLITGGSQWGKGTVLCTPSDTIVINPGSQGHLKEHDAE